MTSRRSFLRSFCAAIALAPALCRLAEKVAVAVPTRADYAALMDAQFRDALDAWAAAIRESTDTIWAQHFSMKYVKYP